MAKFKLLLVCLGVLVCTFARAAQSDIPKGYEPPVLFMADRDNPLDLERQRERYLLVKLLMPVMAGDSAMVMPMSRSEALEAGLNGEYYDYVKELADAFNKSVAALKPEVREAFIERHKTMRNRLESLISLQYIYFDDRLEIVDGLTPEIAREIGFSNEAYVQIRKENQRVMDRFNDLLRKYSRHVDITANISQIAAEAFGFNRSLFIEPEVPLPDGGSYVSRRLEKELKRINKKYRGR